MVEILQVKLYDFDNKEVLSKNFKSYNFYTKPFLELAKSCGLDFPKNKTFLSNKEKEKIISLIKDDSLKTFLSDSFHTCKIYHRESFQRVLTALGNDIGSYNEILDFLLSNKSYLDKTNILRFDRIQVERI